MADDDILVNIRGAAEDLRRASREAIRDLKDVGQEARRQTAQGAVLGAENKRVARSYDEIGDQARQAAGSMALYNREADKVRIRSNGVSQGLRDISVNMRAIGWTTLLANIGPASSGLLDLAAGATAAGTALAPLGGLAATIPYAFGVGAQATFAWKLAFNGMEDAINGNKDALAALDPLQRQFVDRIRNDLAPEIQKLQGIAQEGILPGADRALTDLLKLSPEVEKVLGRTSKVIGGLLGDAGNLITKPGFQKDLQRFGLTNAELLDKGGHAALSFADGMRHITAAADPLVRHLGDLTEKGGKLFDQWAEKERKSGGLADFFDLTSTRVDQSLSILGDVGGIIGSIVSGSKPLADSLMDGLVDDMDHLHDLVSSSGGQADLKKFFSDVREPLGAVSHLLGDVVKDIADLGIDNQGNLTNLANTLDQKILPPIKGLADILTDLLPHAIDLAGDLGDLASAVEPGLKPVAGAIGDIADGLGDVIDLTTELTDEMPGIGKLVPALTLGAGTIAGWRAVKGALDSLRGGKGKFDPISLVFGKGGLGSSPTNPMWVAVVGQGPGGDTNVLPGEGPDREKGPRPSRTRTALTTAGNLVLPLAVTAYGIQATAGQNQLPTLIGGQPIISQIQQGGASVPRQIQDLNRQIAKVRAGATDKKFGGGPGGLLDPAVGKAIQDLERYRDRLIEAQKAIQPLVYQVGQLKKAGDTKGLASQADQIRTLAAQFPEASAQIEQFATKVDRMAERTVKPQFRQMKDAAGESLKTIDRTASETSGRIAQKLGNNTRAGKDALAHNFALAAQAVAKSMKDGEVSTQEGLAKIDQYMRKYLAQYGIKGKEATRYLNGQDTKTGRTLGTGNEGGADLQFSGNARGGLHEGLNQLGRPGAAGRDNIPMLLNGRKVMAAEGETVAVLNRHQRAKLDRLAGRGGLAGFIKGNSRPNYMASGGIVDAAGGLQLPAGFSSAHPYSHDTAGLPGYPATDVFGAPGTVVLSPVDGVITKFSGQAGGPGGGGAFGYSLYIDGANGESYYLTHMGSRSVHVGQRVHRGQPIGTVADYPDRADHIHEGIHGGTTGIMPSTGGGGGGAAAVEVPKIPRVKFAQGLGTISAIGQAGLDRVRGAAQDQLAQLLGGGAGSFSAGPGALSREKIEQLIHAVGLPEIFADISYAESRWNPSAHNPSGASGLWQIMMPLHQALVARYGGNVYDPLTNAKVAKALYEQAGLSPWTASRGLWAKAGTYAAEGWLNAASGLDTIVGLGDPKAPKKNPKKSSAAAKRPKTSGPGRPDLSKVKPGARHHGAKQKARKVPQWIRSLLIADGQEGVLGFLPDFDATFEAPIARQQSAIQALAAALDLTTEEPTVTLYDSAQYADLTNWLNAHPEDLSGAKTAAEFIDKYGNGLEVVNMDGLSVQGQKVRGIKDRVGEIQQLLAAHTGSGDGTGQAELIGNMIAYLGAMTTTGPQALGAADGYVASVLRQLAKAREMRRDDLQDEQEKLKDLRHRGTPYTRRVATLQAQIDRLRQYKEDISKAAIGHRLTDEGQQNRQWATDKISDLGNEIQQLNAEYGNDPDGRLLPDMPVKPQGKAATKRAMAAYRAALAKWQRKQRAYERMLAKSEGQVAFDRSVIDKINDITPQWTHRHDAIVQKGQDFQDRATSLQNDEIPGEKQEIAALQTEMAGLLGTRVAPRPLDNTTTAAGADNSELNALLKQQLEETRKNFAISQAQYPVFQQFAALAGQRLLGSFLHGTGTGYVPETGPYLLHANERVIPAADGPFYNQAQAQQAQAPVVTVYVDGDAAPFIKRVRAEIDGRAARVANQQIGRKGRLIAAAPGGR